MAAYCESCCREQQTCEGCRNLADKLRAAQRVLDELEFALRNASDRAAAMDIIDVFIARSASRVMPVLSVPTHSQRRPSPWQS